MELLSTEIDLIEFLFNYRINCEIESGNLDKQEILLVNESKGNYKEMFEFSSCYHCDDRLSFEEGNIIDNIYSKLEITNN